MVDQPDVHRPAFVIDNAARRTRVYTCGPSFAASNFFFDDPPRGWTEKNSNTVPSAAEEFFGSNKSCQRRQSISIKTMVGKPATFLALLFVLHNYEMDADSADYRPTTVVPQPVGGSSRRVTSSP